MKHILNFNLQTTTMESISNFKIKRSFKIMLVMLFCLTALSNRTEASHAMGMDLTYVCLGGNQYEFTLNFYRDCSGISAPTTASISLNSASCGISNTLNLTQTGPGVDISPLCPTALSTCSGGTIPGVEHYEYKGTFTLPSNCPDWIFSYSTCCRNPTITNLQSPSSQSIYIESTLDNSSGICNNSPTFTTLPVPYICKDQLTNYSFGALDSDGDSIIYSLIAAMGSSGVPLLYVPPYSATYPITTDSGFVDFDSLSGNLNLTPDTTQTSIVTVLVQEFRNGVMIGSIMRDIQLLVLDCGSNSQPAINSPFITNLTGGATLLDSNSIEVCVGVPVNFDLIASDIDVGDTLLFTTNLSTAIPLALFDTTGINPVIGSFTWVPTINDLGSHSFTATIEDDNCPILGRQTYVFDIRVFGGLFAGSDIIQCGVDSIQLSATGSLNYAWSPSTGLSDSTISNPMALVTTTTTYIVTGDSSGTCKFIDTITVFVDTTNSISVSATNTVICEGDSVVLSAVGSSGLPDTSSWTYSWSPVASLSDSTAASPIAFPSDTTLYVLEVSNSCGVFTDSITINTKAAPAANAGADAAFCFGGSVQLTGSGGVTYLWSPNLDLSCTACDKTNANPSSDMTYILTAFDSLGCSASDSVFVEVNGVPVTASSDKTFICAPGDSVNLSAEGISDCNDYNVQSISFLPVVGTGTNVVLGDDQVSPGLPIGFTFNFYCNDYTTFYISSNGFITFTNDPNSGCCSGQLIPNASTPNNLIAFVWDDMYPPGNGTIDYFTIGIAPNRRLVMNFNDIPFCCGATPQAKTQVLLYENGNHVEIHTTYATGITPGTMGLENIDGTLAHVVAGRNSSAWTIANDGMRFSPLTAPLLDTTLVYTWTPGSSLNDSTISAPIAFPSGDVTYVVQVNDNGCIQTDTVSIFMDTTVLSVFGDTTLCALDTAMLNVTANTGLVSYQWNPTTGLSNATIQNPTANPTATTDYTVTVVNSAGCQFTSDTVTVTTETAPAASFTETTVDLTATFTNSSVNAISFSWDFGDGFLSTQTDPVHTFNANGTYNVCLTATNFCGNSVVCSTVTVTLGGCVNTVAAFDTVVSDLTVVFSDLSSDADTWAWDFGDGNTSASQNVVHTFTADGTYNVCLITTNPCSSDTTCMMVTVTDAGAPPCTSTVAGFTSSSVGLDAVFVDGSSDATSWSWDFGDGNTSIGQNPVHTYAADGTYNVCLIASNACSSDTTCMNVIVSAANCTAAVAGFTSAPSGLTVNFTDTSTDPTGWAWDFGDGNTSTAQNPVNTYATAGTYTVCLTVTNPCSTDSLCSTVTVVVCSTPVASYTSTANDLTVTLADASTGATSWSWDFGDGNTSNAQNPVYTFSTAGTYYVCLTANSGCATDVFCDSITVSSCPAVVAAFTFTDSLLTVDFNDLSIGAGNWSWDFGDGSNSSTQNASHTYATAGTYNVCLTVSSVCASDSTCFMVSVITVGIDDANMSAIMEVYPNPTNGKVNITLPVNTQEDKTITIYNILGEIVFEAQQSKLHAVQSSSIQSQYIIDLGYLSDGSYLLKVQSGDKLFMEQIILSK